LLFTDDIIQLNGCAKSYEYTLLRNSWSIITNAAMASTMGTALGNTHGSCRPVALSEVSAASVLTVCCVLLMVETGLNAHRK
jgi:hypothetical protein